MLGGVVVAIGLTFWWALIAIAAGTLADALFIALHATQGPRLGVPQTIQSRVLIALLGYKHFVSNLSNFLDVLLVIFIPWSAVNLTDYFLVRRGNYDVTAFFIPDGVYGKFAWRGLLAYAVGLAAEWPFVSQPDYVGPLVSYLGGADISWLVGFFVSAVVYLILVVSSATETGRHERQVAATSRW